jgi:hypothetical protein
MKIEHTVKKSDLRQFRNKENTWKNRSYQDRLDAMAVICGTSDKDGETQSGFSRFYSVTRKTSC